MFDIGWIEMLTIGVVVLLVVGPKDLPGALRTAGHWIRKAQSLARDFQGSLEDMAREADLDEAKKQINRATNIDLKKELDHEIDPDGTLKTDMKPSSHWLEDPDIDPTQGADIAPSTDLVAEPYSSLEKINKEETASKPKPKTRKTTSTQSAPKKTSKVKSETKKTSSKRQPTVKAVTALKTSDEPTSEETSILTIKDFERGG